MSAVFHYIVGTFGMVYIDDWLICSRDKESHYKHREMLLFRPQENALYDSSKKGELMKDEIDFLAPLTRNNGIQNSTDLVGTIKKCLELISLTDLHGFLGHASPFDQFISDFAKLAFSLKVRTTIEIRITSIV